MTTVKIIIGIVKIFALLTCVVGIVWNIVRAKKKASICDTCKWLTSKNVHAYNVYKCHPNGGFFSEWNHKPPEYCEHYCKRGD